MADHTVLRLEDFERRRFPFTGAGAMGADPAGSAPAPMETLCGFHAQKASLSFPHNYTARDALGPDSRVIITGVTDMVGMRLALALRHRCRADVVVAVDPTFPNTIADRLRLLQPLQVLEKHLPKVPILWSHMGLDPLKREPQHALLNATGEIDLVQTFRPTHIVHLANYFQNTAYNNPQHPYVKLNGDQYRSSLYHVRASLAAMEQVLAAIAAVADEGARPRFVYASSAAPASGGGATADQDAVLKAQTHVMQDIMASLYYARFGVLSTTVRLPDGVFGPYIPPRTDLHRLMTHLFDMNRTNTTDSVPESLGLLYVDDAVDALVAAMQFRSNVPVPFALAPRGTMPWESLQGMAKSLLLSTTSLVSKEWIPDASGSGKAEQNAQQLLSWSPRTTVEEGLVRTMAWFLDQNHPFAHSSAGTAAAILTGDALRERHSLTACTVDDPSCRAEPSRLPCASECVHSAQCTPSIFDSIIEVMQDVTEGCEVVLYTQLLANDAADLSIHTEYMDDGVPLICTVAFVSYESPLVQAVIRKVPDNELAQLGVVPRPEDLGAQEAIHNLKRQKLNGRLLYLGWVLVWPDQIPDPLPHASKFLLKLVPGRLVAKSVKQAVFIEESFGVSPKQDDIKFLVQQLRRDALPKRTVKKKTPPKTKIRLPAEPARRAVLLMPELRQQESARPHGPPREKVSIKQASRYMRYEVGERPLGKEPAVVKAQREFYELMVSFVNRNTMRSPLEPQYSFALKHWVRTRWVVHDLELEEGRQLRCDWYNEHLQWDGSTLDQLSFAYVMAKRDLERRLRTEAELNDRELKAVADWTEIKRLLTDVLEWHALLTDRNRDYTPYGELIALPYDHVDSEEGNVEGSELVDSEPLLFARIMSDRTMTRAREDWYESQTKDEENANGETDRNAR